MDSDDPAIHQELCPISCWQISYFYALQIHGKLKSRIPSGYLFPWVMYDSNFYVSQDLKKNQMTH